jgi:signal transduction histidine kinase
MVGDLLLVARLENGVMKVRAQPVPVVTLLETAARGFAPRAADRKVSISVQGDRDLMAHLDLDLSQRLLDNLLANALRYVRQGDRIELAATVAGTELRLAVRNSGPPIPDEVRARLFERHAPGVNRDWHNAGLGLHLCQLVAEVHGGRMVLADTPGWNVAFEACLPGALG